VVAFAISTNWTVIEPGPYGSVGSGIGNRRNRFSPADQTRQSAMTATSSHISPPLPACSKYSLPIPGFSSREEP